MAATKATASPLSTLKPRPKARLSSTSECGEAVEPGGFDKVFLADHESDGVGSTHVLGAEADGVGAAGGDVLHSLDGKDLEGGVYDYSDASGFGDGDHLGQGKGALRAVHVGRIKDSRGVGAYGLLKLGFRNAVFVTYLN